MIETPSRAQIVAIQTMKGSLELEEVVYRLKINVDMPSAPSRALLACEANLADFHANYGIRL